MKIISIPIIIFSSLHICFAGSHQNELLEYYEYWKKSYFKSSLQVRDAAYIDYKNNQTTVSEAHGYGMLITIYSSALLNRKNKKDFDALNRFRKEYRSHLNPHFMAWYIDDKKNLHEETTCASDGDLDIAYSLLLASKLWGDKTYMKEANKLIQQFKSTLIRKDGSLRRGDWDIHQHSMRLSDFMPTHIKAFAKVDDHEFWTQTLNSQYKILENCISLKGAFPDFVIYKNEQWQAAPANLLESPFDGDMYYNSCRVPWRLACDAIEHKELRALSLLAKFNHGIGKTSNHQYRAGYYLNGLAIPKDYYPDGAFSAPHLCSLKVNLRHDEFEEALDRQFKMKEGYYQDSIRLLCLFLVTGNTFLF